VITTPDELASENARERRHVVLIECCEPFVLDADESSRSAFAARRRGQRRQSREGRGYHKANSV